MIGSPLGRFTLLACLLWASPLWAAKPGKADLEQAIDRKLTAEGAESLGEVINLCQHALDKGLDAEDEVFAKKLLASTLSQRGEALSDAIFKPEQPDPRWPQLRKLALADLERSLRHEAEQPKVYITIARLQALPGGDDDKAIAALDEAIKRSGKDVELRFQAIIMRSSLHDNLDDKLGDLSAAIELKPADAMPLRARGALYMAAQKADQALADFEAALKLEPDHAITLEAQGAALALLDRLDESQAAYAKSIALAPESISARLQRAQVSLLQKKYADAVADLSKVLEIDDKNIAARMLRAQVHLRNEQFDAALVDVNQVLKTQPNMPPALRARAQIQLAAGKPLEAIADLERIVAEQPQDLETLFQLAVLYRTQHNFAKAVTLFDRVLKVKPDAWFVVYGRADTYLSVGRHREALADYESAYAIEQKDTGLLNNFAWLLATSPDEKVRDGKRSIALATKAAELTEHKQAHILSTLAAAYAESGDFESAKKWSRQALEVADSAQRDALQQELASYEAGKAWRELQQDDKNVTRAPADKQSR